MWPTTGRLAGSVFTASPRVPAGSPPVEVTYDIDATGILNVSAKDKDQGAEQRITHPARGSNLDKSEVERMVSRCRALLTGGCEPPPTRLNGLHRARRHGPPRWQRRLQSSVPGAAYAKACA